MSVNTTTELNRQDTTSRLPGGWRWAKLGDVCKQDREIVEPNSKIAANLQYISLEHVETNTGRILRQPADRVDDEGKSTTFAFDSRHVLYGKLRPYLNKVALPEFAGRCTTEIIPLLPRDCVDREFLCRLLRRAETVEAAMRDKTGSRMPRADMDELMKLEIPLPPLAEQKRIAGILKEQMAAVERARAGAEAQMQAAENLPTAYIRAVFSSPEAQAWERKPFGELVENFDGRRVPVKLEDRRNKKGQYPYYGASGIIDYVDDYLFDGEFLLIGEDGANLVLRSSPIAFKASGKFWVNNHAHIVQPKGEMPLDYLLYFFGATDLKPYVTGAAQPKLTQEDLNSIPVPVAPPADQRRIAAQLSSQMASAERLRQMLTDQLDAINKLPAALLREAFSGRV